MSIIFYNVKTSEISTNLNSYINSFITQSQNDREELVKQIIDSFQSIVLKKNEFLVQENKICTFFCYIESGILQHAILVDSEEKTTYLALRNSVTSSLKSFLNKIPSQKSIKAISECNLKVIDLETFQRLMKNNEVFKQFYHNLIEKQIMLIDDYRIDLLTLNPEERYKKLLLTEPKLLQEVPLHYLASFLGISTRNMSRIRKNVK